MPTPIEYDGQTFPGWLFPEHEPMGTNQSRGLTLDSGRQLFLDNFGIYSGEWHPALAPQGVSRTWHQAQKHPANPLIVPDRPWEHMVYLYGDVLFDRATGQWRMWYTNNDFGGPLQQGGAPFDFFSMEYATSRDGISWEKPMLGLVERAGQDTNVVINGYGQELRLGAHNVVEDPEAADPGRRYRMLLNWIKYNPGQGPDPRSGFYQYFSPDGLHWDLSQGKRIVPIYQDSPGVFFKDRGRWLMFIRPRMVDRRLILVISEDGETWQPVGNILEPDVEDGLGNEPYVVGVRPYGCGYIMLVSLFQHHNNSRVDHHLYWSRNLLVWHRCNRPTPIIPLGPPGSWDSEVQYIGQSIVTLEDEIRIYYGGGPIPHSFPAWDKVMHSDFKGPHMSIGLATLRRDGWVSMGPSQPGGQGRFATEPLTWAVGRLHVNVDAHRGRLRAALYGLDRDPGGVRGGTGTLLPGFGFDDCIPVAGDHLSAAVTWRGGERPAAPSGYRLVFELEDAQLYSYWAE